METFLKVFALLADAAGIILLSREVWRAHQMEILGRQIDYELDMIELLGTGRQREAYEREQMWQGTSPKKAKESAAHLSDAALELWARTTLNGTASPKEVKWTKDLAEQRNSDRRRLLLLLGTCLLVLSSGMEVGIFFLEKGADNKTEVKKPQSQIGEGSQTQGPTFFRVEPTIEFGSGKGSLTYSEKKRDIDLKPTVCSAKKALRDQQSAIAIVIGRHDDIPLSKRTHSSYTSNAGLAQRRAEEVARYLRSSNECGLGIGTVISLSGPPINVGEPKQPDKVLAQDRIVEIYGFGIRRIGVQK